MTILPWTTSDELEFIQGLGTHCPTYAEPRSREAWLEGYIRGWSHRKQWGNLNADRILAFAEEELQKCRNNGDSH